MFTNFKHISCSQNLFIIQEGLSKAEVNKYPDPWQLFMQLEWWAQRWLSEAIRRPHSKQIELNWHYVTWWTYGFRPLVTSGSHDMTLAGQRQVKTTRGPSLKQKFGQQTEHNCTLCFKKVIDNLDCWNDRMERATNSQIIILVVCIENFFNLEKPWDLHITPWLL